MLDHLKMLSLRTGSATVSSRMKLLIFSIPDPGCSCASKAQLTSGIAVAAQSGSSSRSGQYYHRVRTNSPRGRHRCAAGHVWTVW